MNLLPKSKEEFSQKEYWDSFFKKRGNKAFEWYGEYPELCEHLHKYIKPKDEVLIVGCGNSSLGNDLYDVGYKNITSIDISAVAIRQMNQVNRQKRPTMKFLEMDATKMSFEAETFSTILDKGTLDALMPDDKQETLETIKSYFDEVLRVLRPAGRYVCVSLLQEHILKYLLEYFPARNCMFRVARCYEAEKSAAEAGQSGLPVFVVVCTKFKIPVSVLEVNLGDGEKFERVPDTGHIVKLVGQVQHAAFVCSGLRRTNINDEDISFELFKSGDGTPRYTIYVVDIKPERKHKSYAAFIAPQGREAEWLFSTREGRKKLAVASKANRLAVVTLHRGHNYISLDEVKNELSDAVRNLAPAMLGNEKILFLTLGVDVGERRTCFEGKSPSSGDYVVEDVSSGEGWFRRLYYLNSQLVIQSEAKLKNDKSLVDVTYLPCGHHIIMSRAVHMAVGKKDSPCVAVIGLGGGSLCSFLRRFVNGTKVTGVDIDPEMLKIAVDWFGLKLDDEMKVEIADGLTFLAEARKREITFDAILFDVDSKDTNIGMSCPPKEFLSEGTLHDVVSTLNPEGLFVLNLVVRDESLRPSVFEKLRANFKTIASFKLDEDLNEVVICSREAASRKLVRAKFDAASKEMNVFFKKHGHRDLIDDIDGKSLKFLNDELN